MLAYLGQHGVLTLLVLTEHGLLGEKRGTIDASFITDSVILLRRFEALGGIRLAVSVIKKRHGNHEKHIRELRITQDLNENLELRVAERTSELERVATELQQSNKELEQFAYIASHDLQAPLRTVSSFLELLARRYKGKLGPEADEYISFAVDGATRMHQLINDIFEYSRLSTRTQALEATDCRAVVDQALRDLEENIRESGAEITTADLPTVSAVKSQMVQLVSNLLSNAIKCRQDEPPRIHIAAERLESAWLFSIRDNGIGFEQQYADRIFRIFQRLHTEGRYPGTGIRTIPQSDEGPRGLLVRNRTAAGEIQAEAGVGRVLDTRGQPGGRRPHPRRCWARWEAMRLPRPVGFSREATSVLLHL